MKITLKSGFKSFVATCNKCGCRFKYELSDIDTGFVNCPECDNDVFHSINNVDKESSSNTNPNSIGIVYLKDSKNVL